MAVGNLGPELLYNQEGDYILDTPSYKDVSVYCALERADMDLDRQIFDQLMKGPRFGPLIHHMAITTTVGMKWNYFVNNCFTDFDNVKFYVCGQCLHLATLRCPCKKSYYCSINCQRRHRHLHIQICTIVK
jgi:hypothetical protein